MRKGGDQLGQGGVPQGGSGSAKPVAFLDPHDAGCTQRISFEEWPGSVRAIGVAEKEVDAREGAES